MVEISRYLVAVVALVGIASAEDLSYWVEPCVRPETGCQAGDPELAQWAIEAWAGISGGRLKPARAADKDSARIRVHWAGARDGLYGEARGNDVYIRLDPGSGLERETVVYLTCLHETGHALGLAHTGEFADIMYNFQFGGDIAEYFGRYTRKLSRREDIRKNPGISDNDRTRLMQILDRGATGK
jgi:hypothetical protein